MKLHILNPGPLTTVQDYGRIGYMKYGITSSGVMDRKSYAEVNKILGNPEDSAVLEATLMGPTIRIEGEGYIAFMGADMEARLDDSPVTQGHAIKVRDGQILSFGMAKSGVRMYLAVSGGIDVPLVMGSRSTNLKIGLGGFEGRKLQQGDVIATFKSDNIPNLNKHFEAEDYKSECSVRVILGPQDDYFTSEDIENFLNKEYLVTPESDRMGIRLSGPLLKGREGMDIVSDGITFGSIQVTSKGLPIVLMADHQTTGGYAKIATVVTEDLSILAQARPGTKIHFQKVTLESMQEKASLLKRITRRLAG